MAENDNLDSLASNDPYKDPGILTVVQKYAPEFVDRLKTINTPGISNSPDEMETWETGEIDRRKQRLPYEGDYAYLTRVLYEETFSVNQFPESPFKLSNGLTVGGLISHFYTFDSMHGVSLSDARDWNLRGKSLGEVLENTPEFDDREKIFDTAELVAFPMQIGRGGLNYLMHLEGPLKIRLLKNPTKSHFKEDVNTFGFRLVKLVKLIPELTEDTKDPELRALFGVREGRKFTKAHLIVSLWKKLGSLVLDENGYYKQESEATREGLKLLIQMRTHPELQFLYKFKSPSGYINEKE